MKAKSLKGIVTLEMERQLAIQFTIALNNQVEELLASYHKHKRMSSWDDLAILGQVKDCLDKHLRATLEER